MKRHNLKDFHIEGEKDIEIEINKKQIISMYEQIMKDDCIEKFIYYLNERVTK